jgi:hypothetical protein
MLLDFEADVVAFASQPFWLHWMGVDRGRRHAPDFFARRADGTGVVIDVRADERIEPADAEAFDATAGGLRPRWLGLPSARGTGSGAGGERALAVALSASALRWAAGDGQTG